MDTRLPPPLVLLIAAVGMALIDQALPGMRADLPGLDGLAIALAAVAIGVMGVAAIGFARRHTSIDPRYPDHARVLITDGVYARSRNPIYLADALLLIAWSVWLGHALALLGAAAFIGYVTHFQIRPEERALAAKFGERYRGYCRRVRRWI